MKKIEIDCTDRVAESLRIYLKMRLHKGDTMDVKIIDFESNEVEVLK